MGAATFSVLTTLMLFYFVKKTEVQFLKAAPEVELLCFGIRTLNLRNIFIFSRTTNERNAECVNSQVTSSALYTISEFSIFHCFEQSSHSSHGQRWKKIVFYCFLLKCIIINKTTFHTAVKYTTQSKPWKPVSVRAAVSLTTPLQHHLTCSFEKPLQAVWLIS